MNRKIYGRTISMFLASWCILLSGARCDKSTNPPPFTGPLELLQPKGGSGQSFKVGDTVQIKWAIHDTNVVRDVGISYSLDGGQSVPTTQLIGTGSTNYPKTTFSWIIDNRHISERFVLIIWRYAECITGSSTCTTPFDKSAPFAIHQ